MQSLKRTLGANMRRARHSRGLSQLQVAEMLDMPVEVYGRMERGAMLPRMERFVELCHALGATPTRLLGFTRARRRPSPGSA
jgi:transcriptional regulator with XRE-family HTH domain